MPLSFGGPMRSVERRIEETKKLLSLLDECDSEIWAPKDRSFYERVKDEGSVLSEDQIAWLRDLVERYT